MIARSPWHGGPPVGLLAAGLLAAALGLGCTDTRIGNVTGTCPAGSTCTCDLIGNCTYDGRELHVALPGDQQLLLLLRRRRLPGGVPEHRQLREHLLRQRVRHDLHRDGQLLALGLLFGLHQRLRQPGHLHLLRMPVTCAAAEGFALRAALPCRTMHQRGDPP